MWYVKEVKAGQYVRLRSGFCDGYDGISNASEYSGKVIYVEETRATSFRGMNYDTGERWFWRYEDIAEIDCAPVEIELDTESIGGFLEEFC